MANAGFFRWDIYNPFHTWQDLEATFCHGSFSANKWKAILRPMDRGVSNWKFGFFLTFDEWFGHRHGDIVDKVRILVDLNKTQIIEKAVDYYNFCKDNQFTYYFQGSAIMPPTGKSHHLVFRIEISFLEKDKEATTVSDEAHFKYLSRNLRQLLVDPQGSNMKLMLRNDREYIKVHSYIMRTRWNNFKKHPFELGKRDTVVTNISDSLLFDILTYMYSGTMRKNWPAWKDAEYIAELFQVMDHYKLWHLQEQLVNNVLRQVQETRNHVVFDSRIFPLRNVDERPMNSSHTWLVSLNHEDAVVLQLRASDEKRANAWLSYSLRSKSRSRVYVQVNLEVVKMVEGHPLQTIIPFHEKDLVIEPNAFEVSTGVLFLGCPETFGEINLGVTGGPKFRYFIRCLLRVTSGETVDHVRCVGDEALQNYLESLQILSYHMNLVNGQKEHVDMQIQSHSYDDDDEGIIGPYEEDLFVDYVHKGLLAVRAPGFRSALTNELDSSAVAEVMKSYLNNEALLIVLDYIYTGKVDCIPERYLDKMAKFAEEAKFPSLLDLVNFFRRGYN